ncbi:zinc finger and BTB domain-containing protein 7B-like isoform X1 [Polypterus senegalus]|nr:zinc finger and BTB domain-containing protein 7B-like isoform X1 [Polypterus senegalus]
MQLLISLDVQIHAASMNRSISMGTSEDGLIGIPFPDHSSDILCCLNEQRRAGLLCDVTIKTQGLEYRTHRAVLAAVSQYFRKLFTAGHFTGSSRSVCQLDCVKPEALDALLEFAYTATLTIRSSGMLDVLRAARLLEIQCVTDACLDILRSSGTDTCEIAEEEEILSLHPVNGEGEIPGLEQETRLQYPEHLLNMHSENGNMAYEETTSAIHRGVIVDGSSPRRERKKKKKITLAPNPHSISREYLNNCLYKNEIGVICKRDDQAVQEERKEYIKEVDMRGEETNLVFNENNNALPHRKAIHEQQVLNGIYSQKRRYQHFKDEEKFSDDEHIDGDSLDMFYNCRESDFTLVEGAELLESSGATPSVSPSHLDKGVRKRKSQTPQQCPVCQKIIHGAGKLPRHMRTHTGEKPFQCNTCGVRFTRNDKLKIHMRKHTGEKPYLCTHCPARFLHSYDLKNHLSLHSGDRPFECSLCHKAFARDDHLQRHLKGQNCLEVRTRRPRKSVVSLPHVLDESAPPSLLQRYGSSDSPSPAYNMCHTGMPIFSNFMAAERHQWMTSGSENPAVGSPSINVCWDRERQDSSDDPC